MNISPSKENILKKIRKALSASTPLPFPAGEGNSSVFMATRNELEMEFATHFTGLLGKFIYCADSSELALQLSVLVRDLGWNKIFCNEKKLVDLLGEFGFAGFTNKDLAGCDVSITSCEYLVARTGSIVLSSAKESGRAASVYAPVHVCIAYVDQLVYDVKDALQLIKDEHGGNLPSVVSFATGASRTADIEKTLVVGVHGPGEVYLFLLER
ncbi:MAG: lactate utilization protein [Chitinophagaceae bacterium]|nr:lactate utilization protein [Chitinophagaceae bacterium]